MTNHIETIKAMINDIHTLEDANRVMQHCWEVLSDKNISFEEFSKIGDLRMKVAGSANL